MASLFFRMQNKMCATNLTLKTWSHWNMWSTPCFLTEHVKTSKEKNGVISESAIKDSYSLALT